MVLFLGNLFINNIFIGCFLRLIMVKRGDRIKISSNWKLLIVILILIIILGFLIYFIAKEDNKNNIIKECVVDSDCVAASCCHANLCVSADKEPDCKGMLCSMECSGPLDCGAGACRCINGKCDVVASKTIK